jgi:hypothetical protein
MHLVLFPGNQRQNSIKTNTSNNNMSVSVKRPAKPSLPRSVLKKALLLLKVPLEPLSVP